MNRFLAAPRSVRPLLVGALAALAACSAPPPAAPLELVTTAALAPALGEFAAHLPYPGVVVRTAADPVAELGSAAPPAGRLRVALVADEACKECFRLERAAGGLVVHGDAPLGVQYGLAQLLEHAGMRFYHPTRTLAPARLVVPDDAPGFGKTVTPALSLRGLHLHTIHPIEGYWAFWEPSAAHLADARRILDWVVKNRGNYVQWVALDDIQGSPARHAAWKEHTRAILDAAHGRGLGVGVGIQLFGLSNVQAGFDLVDEALEATPARAQIDARLPALLDGLPWDRVNLSFGEFFSAAPADFIAAVNAAYASLAEHAPGTEMAATIHVGNQEDQRVTYMGQELQYYFLVQFADPAIVPWVHSVMYYNLFDDAGGAYGHAEFDEHRDYLLARLAAGERAAYFPESAYWVAFDVSVPQYLPLYVLMRARDLSEIAARVPGGLDEHVLFSSGWEWGYWQNDYATLRMNYDGNFDPDAAFASMWAPYGEKGAGLAALLAAHARTQRQRLVVERLAPYLAGRDVYIDAGFEIGVVAQPDRPSFAEAAAFTAPEREAFTTSVLARLDALASETAATLAAVRALGLPAGDPFVAEIEDGLAIGVARAHAIAACYRAALAFGAGADGAAELATAEAARAEGLLVVERRHATLGATAREELTGREAGATIYPFGYLQKADELCYWQRELVEVRNLLGKNDATPPNCVF